MIVITKNGKTTVITGWRAWLVSAGVFVGVSLLLGLIAFLMLASCWASPSPWGPCC